MSDRSNTIVAQQISDAGAFGRTVLRLATGTDFFAETYGTCGPSATGAQNRDTIQAAINAAAASGVYAEVHLPAGVLNIDKAAAAEPGQPSNDYCLRAASNVTLVGHGTTIRLTDDQLVFSPSVRQLAIISGSTLNTNQTLSFFGVKGITFDGNAQGQGGFSTYDQHGATSAIRIVPGAAGDDDEAISDLTFENLVCQDFFGNPGTVGGGSGEIIQRIIYRDITHYRCGEGWSFIKCQYVRVSNITYIDDNPDTLLGVGTGFVTVGDPHEFSECFDLDGVGVYVFAIGTIGSGINSGAGSALELYESVRVKMSQIHIEWNNGISCGTEEGPGCNDIELSQVHLICPTDAADSANTDGIVCCPNLILSDVRIENYGNAVRIMAGTRTVAGTGCIVDANNLVIVGGGASASNRAVTLGSGGVFRCTNLQVSGMGANVTGVYVVRDVSGVDADTRLELTGGKISSPGAAILIDGGGTTFAPFGFVNGVDASGAFAGAWPFTNPNSGSYNNIFFSRCLPTAVTTTAAGYYAGAEILTINGSTTALANGSKNQVLLLKVPDVANPFTPSGTFNFGSTSAATASRINMSPYLVLQPFENGAGVYLRRDDAGVYQETGRIYPVHQNRPMILSYVAPLTVGATYDATPTNIRMNSYGRIQRYQIRFSNLSAARTAGTITVVLWRNSSSVATVLTINASNTTSATLTMPVRVGTPFSPDDLLRLAITVSGDFTNSGGATDLILEMACET